LTSRDSFTVQSYRVQRTVRIDPSLGFDGVPAELLPHGR
jgi:hypothetical protein